MTLKANNLASTISGIILACGIPNAFAETDVQTIDSEIAVGGDEKRAEDTRRPLTLDEPPKTESEFAVQRGAPASSTPQLQARADGDLVVGDSISKFPTASGVGALAGGDEAIANGAYNTAFGKKSEAVGDGNTAIGYDSKASAGRDSAGSFATAIGARAEAMSDVATAVGASASAIGDRSIAVGASASAHGDNAVAIGAKSSVNVDDGVALGSNARTNVKGSVALGSGSIASTANTVSVGNQSLKRKIVNVADGDLSDSSTEVVTGKQLYATNTTLSNLNAVAVTYDNTDKSALTLGGTSAQSPVRLQNVADGIKDNDAVNLKQLKSAGIIDADDTGQLTSLAVSYDNVQKNTVTLGGVLRAGGPVTLTNVADGKNPSDAVNYGQLNALKGKVTTLEGRVNTIEGNGHGNAGGTDNGGQGNNGTGGTGESSGSWSKSGQSVADALGGGAKLDANNQMTMPSYTVGGERVQGVEQAVSHLDRRIDNVQAQVGSVARQAYAGIAAATALTMVPGVDPGKRVSFGIGMGAFKGHGAIAVGGEARISENLKVRVGMGFAGGNNTAGAGAAYQW